jgi:DNA-binding GntR family transcriptional regulator
MTRPPTAIERTGHTFSDKVELLLRSQIISGQRLPGERLNEVEIANELGVSRGPVREAMQRLARDGLVQIQSHRGAFVRALNPDEVRELFEVRAALECVAAAYAAERASDEDIARICGLLDEVTEAIRDEQAPHYPDRLDLHDLIVQAAGNEALARTVRQVNQELRLARAQSGFRSDRARQAYDEHAAVVEAIRARDAKAAHACMERHLKSALEHTLTVLLDGAGAA